MDVVNWLRHVSADASRDIYWRCAAFYGAEVVRLWSQARLRQVRTVEAINDLLDHFTQDILCRALSIDGDLGKPAGGASSYYSSDSLPWSLNSRPILPRGVASERDADRIIQGWRLGLEAYRSTSSSPARVPSTFPVLARDVDICATPEVNHVSEADLQFASQGRVTPDYWVDWSSLVV